MSSIRNATTFLLLVGAAFLPLLLIYYQQQREQQQEHDRDENIEDSVAMVVDIVRKVRRQLQRGRRDEEVDDENPQQERKRSRSSRLKHDRARQELLSVDVVSTSAALGAALSIVVEVFGMSTRYL